MQCWTSGHCRRRSTRLACMPVRARASMLAAAASWDGLAADLRSQAASYSSVVSGLTSGGWRGPASASMAAAAAPYAAWMNTTAAQAEQTAARPRRPQPPTKLRFRLTVPPPVIAANRAQLAIAGGDQRPGAKHPGDRGHRGPLRRNVGPRRRGDVRLRRPSAAASQLTR